MTEDEAKTKWCPMAHPQTTNNCVGSGCMMWREKHITGSSVEGTYVKERGGFCGLAGKV